MNKEVKALWIDRLRNGNIPQAKRALGYTDGSRCCLGVLCDIAVEQGVIPPPVEDVDRQLRYGKRDSWDELAVLPKDVLEWSDLPYANGSWLDDDDYCIRDGLAHRNDQGYSFAELADIIEEKF